MSDSKNQDEVRDFKNMTKLTKLVQRQITETNDFRSFLNQSIEQIKLDLNTTLIASTNRKELSKIASKLQDEGSKKGSNIFKIMPTRKHEKSNLPVFP